MQLAACAGPQPGPLTHFTNQFSFKTPPRRFARNIVRGLRFAPALVFAVSISACDTSAESEESFALLAAALAQADAARNAAADENAGGGNGDGDGGSGGEEGGESGGGSGGSGGGGPAGKIIFVTAGSWNGNMGDLAGVDAKCNADANKPNSSTYKALVNANGAIAASQDYVRSDGTTAIATSNGSGQLPATLTNSIGTSAAQVWTGVGGNDCNGQWRTDSIINAGDYGEATATNSSWRDAGSVNCSNIRSLYCVEQ